MNPVIQQIVDIYKNMPLPRKIIAGTVIVLVVTGFALMFYFANKTEFKPLYSNLSGGDASLVVQKLKELKVPYKLEKNGKTILVPSENVYDTRLTMAGAGIPKGNGVGFEIFDKTEFGTTEFVQKINYKRALQGELSRTIEKFDEVEEARVMIVMPKDSVFVEDTKPASASVLLRLKKNIPESKIDAIVNLVASAVKDLPTERVTVTDTSGRILYKGKSEAEKAAEIADKRVKTQMKYKEYFEENLSSRIQSMLERIVGKDRAIVRVSTEMDFSKEDINEEIYDPKELNVPHVRSRKNISESKEELKNTAENVSSVNPVVPPNEATGPNNRIIKGAKQQDIVNYEISKRVTTKEKPFAVIKKISVAAVIDGIYNSVTDENGNKTKKYVARTNEDIKRFTDVVRNAMGFNEGRGDQVTVQSFQFSSLPQDMVQKTNLTPLEKIQKDYGKLAANLVLLILFFLFVIRPVMKTVKEIKAAGEKELEMEKGALLDITDEDEDEGDEELPWEELPAIKKAEDLAKQDMDKTANILKSWLREE